MYCSDLLCWQTRLIAISCVLLTISKGWTNQPTNWPTNQLTNNAVYSYVHATENKMFSFFVCSGFHHFFVPFSWPSHPFGWPSDPCSWSADSIMRPFNPFGQMVGRLDGGQIVKISPHSTGRFPLLQPLASNPQRKNARQGNCGPQYAFGQLVLTSVFRHDVFFIIQVLLSKMEKICKNRQNFAYCSEPLC